MAMMVMMSWVPTASSSGGALQPVSGLAASGFELDSGMSDLEAVAEGAVNTVEDGAALRHGHLGNGDVAGESVRVRSEAPDM